MHIHSGREFQVFDDRLQKMEGMFADFLEKFGAKNSGSTSERPSLNDADATYQPSPPLSVDRGYGKISFIGDIMERASENSTLPVNPGVESEIYAPQMTSTEGGTPILQVTPGIGGEEIETVRSNESLSPADQVIHRRKRVKYEHQGKTPPSYADAYGELHSDEWGQIRYVKRYHLQFKKV